MQTKEIPPEGIFVFGSQLHAHLTGRKLSSKLVRNGEERQFINKDDHYSPHWQVIRYFNEPIRVFPVRAFQSLTLSHLCFSLLRFKNDMIITSCTHNTKDRRNATVVSEFYYG